MHSLQEEIISVVKIVEAVKRIERGDYLKYTTFFSELDRYTFSALSDFKVCPECDGYDGQTFIGNHLRSQFPYLEILDILTVHPMVHPHCRCELNRITDLPEEGR